MPRHLVSTRERVPHPSAPRADGFPDTRRTLLLSGRRTLLLADDSPTIQKVVSLTFEDELEVVAVSDGAQALRLLESATPPDILLADVWMPGPNGYELCEHV